MVQGTLERIFARAGIRLFRHLSSANARPADVIIHDPRFYRRVLFGGNLALGNSYIEGWWDAQRVDMTLHKLLRSGVFMKWYVRGHNQFVNWLRSRVLNLQTINRSRRVVERHFDIGNELYEGMLDRNMQYSCGYWKGAQTLDESQINKMKLISDKLGLQQGMCVAELGGGFGGLSKFMAERGCSVSLWNISHEQVNFAREFCAGLPVTIYEDDYRNAYGTYDRVVAIGLCEHVGHKNYRRPFFETVHRILKEDGLFLMQTIGATHRGFETEAWLNANIFPNSALPTMTRLARAFEPLFVLEDWHNLHLDYVQTLRAWRSNFHESWTELTEAFPEKYDVRFKRMWDYYLNFAIGLFTSRAINISQFVFSKGGLRVDVENVLRSYGGP